MIYPSTFMDEDNIKLKINVKNVKNRQNGRENVAAHRMRCLMKRPDNISPGTALGHLQFGAGMDMIRLSKRSQGGTVHDP